MIHKLMHVHISRKTAAVFKSKIHINWELCTQESTAAESEFIDEN